LPTRATPTSNAATTIAAIAVRPPLLTELRL
jgi:hypothetical protein